MVIFLTTAWVLLVMPVVTPQLPNPVEQQLFGASFENQKDCEDFTKAPGNLRTMTEMAYAPAHHQHLQQILRDKEKRAPAGAPVTYTCVERDNP